MYFLHLWHLSYVFHECIIHAYRYLFFTIAKLGILVLRYNFCTFLYMLSILNVAMLLYTNRAYIFDFRYCLGGVFEYQSFQISYFIL